MFDFCQKDTGGFKSLITQTSGDVPVSSTLVRGLKLRSETALYDVCPHLCPVVMYCFIPGVSIPCSALRNEDAVCALV